MLFYRHTTRVGRRPVDARRRTSYTLPLMNRNELSQLIESELNTQDIIDLHTHLYAPAFGTTLGGPGGRNDPQGLLLWGIDELLNYHYLVQETFRVVPATEFSYERFWKMDKTSRADHIFKTLFVERSPVSEACRGVLSVIQRLGLDPADRDLNRWRKWFAAQDPSRQIDRVMELSHITSITMTNPVFDDNERGRWEANRGVGDDPRFKAVLRIDPLLRDWPGAAVKLGQWGYKVQGQIDGGTIEEVRRFLRHWLDYMKAIYMAVSLPPEFTYPADLVDPAARAGQEILEKAILPVCAERGIPFAMMIGATTRVNPDLREGGDMVGKSDIASVVRLCHNFPKNRFLMTMLSRENQHELCVAARSFGNLMPFGCWWFVNTPTLIEEITRMRVELLGTSFIPQHSDARVLEQMLYKWDHTRRVLSKVLSDKYDDMRQAGWVIRPEEIKRDIGLLLRGNFKSFLGQNS